MARRKRGELSAEDAYGRLDVLGLRLIERGSEMLGLGSFTDDVAEHAEEFVDSAIDFIGEERLELVEKLIQHDKVKPELMRLVGLLGNQNGNPESAE